MNTAPGSYNDWIDECHQGTRYGMEGKILIDENSSFQRITLIESKRYGKGLLLDGCWMTAEYQEKYYHEPLVHPALCSSKTLSKVLLIGGGDGGTARECLKHQAIERPSPCPRRRSPSLLLWETTSYFPGNRFPQYTSRTPHNDGQSPRRTSDK